MKREELFVTVAIAAGVALSSPAVNATGFNSPEARAYEAAQQGPDQLRHFINRTRMVYALNFNDYYRPAENVPDADISADSAGYAAPAPSEGEAAPQDAQAISPQRQKELDAFREQLYRDLQHD